MSSTSGFGARERAAVDSYLDAEPKMTGNLHERMKWLLSLHEQLQPFIEQLPDDLARAIFQDARQAAFDLQTEVAYTTPGAPPFAHRPGAPRLHDLRLSSE